MKKELRKRLTEYEVMERRTQVQKMRLRGLSVPAIAKLLKNVDGTPVSEQTIHADLRAIQKENVQLIDKADKIEWVAQSIATFKDLEERAWADYHSSKDGTRDRIAALNLIRSIENDKIKILTSTGFIKADPKQIDVNVDHYHEHDKIDVNHQLELKEAHPVWTKEIIDDVSKALMDRLLTTNLADPVPPEDIIDAEFEDVTPVKESEED